MALLLVTPAARADGPVDTVFLADGGRLRGIVTEDDPRRGVTIKLVDGTIRKVKRTDVARVEYADAPAPAIASPSSPGGQTPTPSAAPSTAANEAPPDLPNPVPTAESPPAYALATVPPPDSNASARTAGLVMLVGGSLALTTGLAILVAASNNDCAQYVEGSNPRTSCDEGITTLKIASVITMAAGAAIGTTGLVLTLTNGPKHGGDATALVVGPGSLAIHGRF
jgi:hypothetical protein